MKRAKEYARDNNVAFCFVETFHFQALGFYQKIGFMLEFTREGYAQRASFHYLSKVIMKVGAEEKEKDAAKIEGETSTIP